MRTTIPKIEEVTRKWYVVDATDRPIGRLAVEIAKILRGKHKPIFARHLDVGDYVIVINAEKAKMSGNKAEELIYWHSTFPGGLKSVSRGKLMATKPEAALKRVVKGMLPHNTLGRHTLEKLKVYAGPTHPHEAQQPEQLSI